MKFLAYNLPAFHRIPENDLWWGEGFTEWDNVKKGKKLYKRHQNPLRPKEFYDLSKKEEVIKQAVQAKKFGIDGFIYYHYWFNGKLLFEKPCEIIRDSDIDFTYCFCWANETWSRTWDGKNNEILIKQTFGGEEDWENHIKYLITFFKDDKYIKINGRPVLFIYSASRIPYFNKMISFWNSFLNNKGFGNLYVVEAINSFNLTVFSEFTDAVTEFEPHYTLRKKINVFTKGYRFLCKKFAVNEVFGYDFVWKKMLKRNETYNGKTIFRSCFVGWDNTPRKGKAGMIINGSSPEKFEKYLVDLINLNNRNYSEYLIINAWNERGEGAVLEESEQYGTQYLEAVLNAKRYCQ